MQNKSQIFLPQSNNSNSNSNLNTYEFLNKYSKKNIMKKLGSPKGQETIKIFNHSSDLLTKNAQRPYELRDFKQTKVNNGL